MADDIAFCESDLEVMQYHKEANINDVFEDNNQALYEEDEREDYAFWQGLGYSISTRSWETYYEFATAIYEYDTEAYWEENHLCWVAQEVLALA
jgi:hypothetical protein